MECFAKNGDLREIFSLHSIDTNEGQNVVLNKEKLTSYRFCRGVLHVPIWKRITIQLFCITIEMSSHLAERTGGTPKCNAAGLKPKFFNLEMFDKLETQHDEKC